MIRFIQIIPIAIAFLAVLGGMSDHMASAQGSSPKGRVNLVIAGEKGAPVSVYHQWSRELGEAGVRNVRIRAARSSDAVDIQTRGSRQYPVYDVTGMIEAGGDLILPGARFSPGDARLVARWVDELIEEGPPQSREPRGAFGLKQREFDRVADDLDRMVDFPTEGETRAAVVERIAERLSIPLRIKPELRATLLQDKIETELAGFSSGTALALVLQPLGLGFVPCETDDGELVYVVVALEADALAKKARSADAATKNWSIGWPPKGQRRKVLPELFKFYTVSVQGVSLGKVLEAIGKKLDAPVLVDRAALARRGIDLEKIDVSLPQRRTTYGLVLNKVLSDAKLKYELRVDEAGRPFIWITTLK